MTAMWPTARRLAGARLLDLRLDRDESCWLLPVIVALAIYIAGLGGIGLLAAGQGQSRAERLLAAAMTVEVPAETSPARLDTALALLKQTSGVLSVQIVGAAATARLLEPWLGPDPNLDELPVPKLIDIRVDPSKTADLATLHKRLTSVVPGAQLDDHRQVLTAMRSVALRLDIVFAGAIAATLAAIAAAATLAARSALRTDRSLIELTHFLGAADITIVRPFAARALYQALCGGAIGAAAAAATVAALGGSGRILDVAVAIPVPEIGDWRVWIILVASVLAGSAIAAACAGATGWLRVSVMP